MIFFQSASFFRAHSRVGGLHLGNELGILTPSDQIPHLAKDSPMRPAITLALTGTLVLTLTSHSFAAKELNT